MEWFAACLLLAVVASQGQAALWFPHGLYEYGEYVVWGDENSEHLQTNFDFWFYGELFNDIYVCTNGYVTRHPTWCTYNPMPMHMVSYFDAVIAPLWGDIYMSDGYSASYRETQDPDMLTKARDAIQPHFTGCGGPEFDPVSLVIVTWDDVTPWCFFFTGEDVYYYYYYYDICNGNDRAINIQQPDNQGQDILQPTEKETFAYMEERENVAAKWWGRPLNSFQLVLATDGVMTFALFNFHLIQWDCCWHHNTSGFSAADGDRYCDLPGSGTSSVSLLETTSNVDFQGCWIYRVDGCEIHDPQCGHCV